MKIRYIISCIVALGLLMIAGCNNSSSPNTSLSTKDTNVVSTDHTKNGNDTTNMNNVKPQVPVPDSVQH